MRLFFPHPLLLLYVEDVEDMTCGCVMCHTVHKVSEAVYAVWIPVSLIPNFIPWILNTRISLHTIHPFLQICTHDIFGQQLVAHAGQRSCPREPLVVQWPPLFRIKCVVREGTD